MALPQGHDVRGMIAKYMATPDYSRLEPMIDKLDRILEVELAGWALARWQTVEEALFDIFAFLHRGSPNELRPVFFRRDLSFRGRINEITVLIEKGAPTFRKKWDELESKIAKQSSSRNKLAHFGFCFHERPICFL